MAVSSRSPCFGGLWGSKDMFQAFSEDVLCSGGTLFTAQGLGFRVQGLTCMVKHIRHVGFFGTFSSVSISIRAVQDY